ncbi:MAG TPA: dicarboxylate/amino acid:cation symporter [bacterium]|nr:dicarboxylate/amino acid:cation symporter [bacterium]HPO07249.1 dicarboxylate/amino acid:cation symporter [bacterium]HQO35292.1 dicarboxylate/amino acid:cation symporter [bacterium]HQP99351.1 dicarboxylate/amino acid:cation symporter [bacterium]
MKLHTKILLSLLAAILFGGMIRLLGAEDFASAWLTPTLGLCAEVFLRLLSMIVIPVVVSSLICGIVGEGKAGTLGRLGIRTVAFYLISSLLAILVGFCFVNIVQPGIGADLSLQQASGESVGEPESWTELLIRIIPSNFVSAMAQGDMIAVIFFTVCFSAFALTVREESRLRIVHFFQAVLDVVMSMTLFIIGLAPYGVFCLVTNLIIETGFAAFAPLAKYFVTVLLALTVHFTLVLPLLMRGLTGLSPVKLFSAMSPALLTAFSTASSNATLPLTMACAERRAGVGKRVSSFVLPLGATVNMDGTALYECVAAIFVAQVLGVELSAVKQFTIIFTALLVSVGAAGIPHAGLVMMVIIFKAVGLPLEATGMIWAVDRFLDMGRTMTNVWSDCVCMAIAAHYESDIDRDILYGKNVEVTLEGKSSL